MEARVEFFEGFMSGAEKYKLSFIFLGLGGSAE